MKLLDNNFIPQFKEDVIWGEVAEGFGTPFTEDSELDLPCQCGHSILRLFRDEHSLSVAFYVYAPSSFMARVKKACKLLFKGERALLDDVVVDNNGVERLKEFLK